MFPCLGLSVFNPNKYHYIVNLGCALSFNLPHFLFKWSLSYCKHNL